MKNYLKNLKGFTTVDLTIAMIIIVIFATIITSILYNAYLSTIEAKRTAVALNYAVDIFEHIGELSYSSVKASEDSTVFDNDDTFLLNITNRSYDSNTNKLTGKIDTYDISLQITNYEGQAPGEDFIKIITLTVEYNISKNTREKVEMQRLKVDYSAQS